MGTIIRKKIDSPIGKGGMIMLLDMGVSTIASIIALLMLRLIHAPFVGFQHYILVWLFLNAVCTFVSFMIFGTYKIVIRYSTFRTVGRLTAAVLLAETLMGGIIATGLIKAGTIQVEIFTLILDALVTVTFLVIIRAIILKVVDLMSTSVDDKINCLNVAIYGVNNKSIALLTRLKESTHYNVACFITLDKNHGGMVFESKHSYYIGCQEDLAKVQGALGIEGILFAGDYEILNEKDGLLSYCINLGISILNAPKIGEAGIVDQDVTSRSARAITVKDEYIRDGMTSFERNVKRIVDMIAAALCIVIFSPLFLIIYIAIKKEDKGPALFRQERIGRFGRPFNIYKFRSMRTDAEAMGPALYSGDDDPRLTKVGKFIRAHHLDELPQLFNVLRGEMAFVGPRPERKFYIDQIMEVDPRYYYLYQIRPGVTSYATLYNGYTDTIEKMVKRLDYDIYYLRNRSWWFDIKILGMTFMSIVFGKKF